MLSSPSFLLLLLLATSSTATSHLRPRTPKPRSYDTHAYFHLDLSPLSTPLDAATAAEHLHLELVEPIGELAGQWLLRTPSSSSISSSANHTAGLSKRDPISRRYDALRASGQIPHARSLEQLTVRKRSKRVYSARDHGAGSMSLLRPQRRQDDTGDLSELQFAQDTLDLHDPILYQQWHLINTQMKDFELNVTGLWERGITGEGVKVCIIDDGLDMKSDDLKDNFFAEGSYDFNDHTELPEPRLSDDQHGTRCAGEIAAVANDVCGVGVSYGAKISGVRILSAPISDADEAAALNFGYQLNDIYSCSWGPPDDGRSMEAPEGLILKAMVNGIQKGRGGKGSVFVFAAGNGGGSDDQCNFDGYTNSIWSITIGAIDRRGLHPYYSEMCSAMMMVAPSSGSGDHIHTTDVGKNTCAHTHGGTSAAAPLGAGVFALALQARPDLTWRDMQHISVQSAVFFNPEDPDWQKTAKGRNYSYKYGYGRIDAGRFVELAESFKSVKPQSWFDSPAIYLPTTKNPNPNAPVVNTPFRRSIRNPAQMQSRQFEEGQDGDDSPVPPFDETAPTPPSPPTPPTPPTPIEPEGSFITSEGVSSTFTVTAKMLQEANTEMLEHVTVRVWITHARRGDVEVEIKSPAGIVSVLARARRFDDDPNGLWGWKFMSLKHWEEDAVGDWTITVKDQTNPDHTGKFVAWSLQLWGECIDPALARDWTPPEEGQPDEEQTGSEAATTAVSQKPKPTAHLPDDHGEAPGESHEPGLGQGSGSGTGDGAEGGEDGNEDKIGQGALDEGWFSGVSNLNNTSWLAGAGGIVLVAGASVGGFFILRQRKKRGFGLGLAGGEGARGAYAPVSDDMPMGLLERGRRKFGGGGGSGSGGGTKDLYDAFGDGPSDEDDESDGEGGGGLRYHDSFLDDEDVSPVVGMSGRAGGGSGKRGEEGGPPGYEMDDDLPRREVEGAESSVSGSGSGSWQDAAEVEEVGR